MLAVVGLLLGADAAHPEVHEQLSTVDYEVIGRDGQSLLSLINAASPIREGGQVFHGYTKWQVNWQFRWHEAADGTCRISRVDTRVDGRMTLPRLRDGTAAQQRRFDSYLAALRRHEMGHYDFAQCAGREIDAGIAALPPMASCQALESAANGLGHRIIDSYTAREKQYDASTDHGRTQGAWLER